MVYYTLFTTEQLDNPDRMVVSLDRTYNLGTLEAGRVANVGDSIFRNGSFYHCVHRHIGEETMCFFAPQTSGSSEGDFVQFCYEYLRMVQEDESTITFFPEG